MNFENVLLNLKYFLVVVFLITLFKNLQEEDYKYFNKNFSYVNVTI